MAQSRSRRLRERSIVRSSEEGPPVASGLVVTEDDVVRSMFHDGVLTPRDTGSIHVKNEQPLATIHQSRDWEKGSALHAAPRPDPSSGAAWHGAPWDWTINGELVENYQYFNIWYEVVPYAATGLPANVRVQFRNIEAWTLNAAMTAWTKVLGPGAASGYQTSSGRPDGGYHRTTPDYVKEVGIEGWTTGGTTQNGYAYSANPGAKWRAETAANGGGWSIDLTPLRTSAGALIDDFAVLHGPFVNTTSPDRIFVPTGGYVAYTGEARLIMNDYSAVPTGAKFVACLGSDMFRAKLSSQDPASARSTSMCNPRHIVLPTDGSWKWLGHCNGSASMIRTTFPNLPFVNG